MRKTFAFRGEGVDFLTQQGFRYCNTLGWFGWWHLEKCQRAIVDFNSKNKKKCWVVTIWKTNPRNLPPVNADYMKV